MKIKNLLLLPIIALTLFACTDKDDEADIPQAPEPQLIVKFKFDPTQVRLDNLGQPSTVPAGNAAQSPIFNTIASHYVEFAPNANTLLGSGTILYKGESTTAGGLSAFDFSKAKIVAEGEAFLSIPLSQIQAGSYEWVRCSLSYQNYNINVWSSGANYVGTLASFVGTRTYITTHNVAGYPFVIDGNRDQGYWAFGLQGFPYSTSGQAPAGATTVPNPIDSTSPIPANSCVVTGKFANNLVITGTETSNIEVTLSLSINNSFEWTEVNADGKYEPSAGENVVDMGLRGLIPSYVR
ncbi:hypothetical protein SAMN05660845_1239 [Flavobacterium swingsii]|uniref:Lipoprotein n=1 Tax=Flavobacterium swingsii TaxID=498292 RepID=A0A1I0XGS4_9FLAO|nr:hypothetical protein [Flavobacterium swingsii]SFB00104.1 hypothetical protein SAMN05660845_1239 [Flavobacterium swingsii]